MKITRTTVTTELNHEESVLLRKILGKLSATYMRDRGFTEEEIDLSDIMFYNLRKEGV